MKNDEARTISDIAAECSAVLTDGKGEERHGGTASVFDQPWFWIEHNIKSFALAQAVKKIHESQRFDKDRQIAELRGAVGYVLLKILDLERT